jgi:hypothetical protein
MASWPWAELPPVIRAGVCASDLAALGPFCAWLHSKIQRRRDYQDHADLAQDLCWELRRLMTSPRGRRLLHSIINVPGFLETLATRLRRRRERANQHYTRADLGLARQGRVPDPAERLEGGDLAESVCGEIGRLAPRAIEVLRLHLEGSARHEIARSLWPKRSSAWADRRVKRVLESVRERLRPILAPPSNPRRLMHPRKSTT